MKLSSMGLSRLRRDLRVAVLIRSSSITHRKWSIRRKKLYLMKTTTAVTRKLTMMSQRSLQDLITMKSLLVSKLEKMKGTRQLTLTARTISTRINPSRWMRMKWLMLQRRFLLGSLMKLLNKRWRCDRYFNNIYSLQKLTVTSTNFFRQKVLLMELEILASMIWEKLKYHIYFKFLASLSSTVQFWCKNSFRLWRTLDSMMKVHNKVCQIARLMVTESHIPNRVAQHLRNSRRNILSQHSS